MTKAEARLAEEQKRLEQQMDEVVPETAPAPMDTAPQVSYVDLADEELQKDKLLSDRSFIEDAETFLINRTGAFFDSDEEVYDAFMEHMRFHETNEVTAVRDLMYAQEATVPEKIRLAKLFQTWDRMEGDPMSWQKAFDYIEAGVTAPSTWLGMATGGAGKLAAAGAQQAAKVGLRVLAGSALRGAAVEGAIGLGTGAAQEEARVETGAQEQFTGGRTLGTALGSAIGGALPAGITGVAQAAMAKRAAGMAEEGAQALSKRVAQGQAKTQKLFDSVKDKNIILKTKAEFLDDELRTAREYLQSVEGPRLRPLDPAKVKQGTKILSEMTQTERTIAKLDDATVDAITAAMIQLGKKVKPKQGERITEAVSRAIRDGRIKNEELEKIVGDFGLTREQFSLVYLAELSKAGRTLGKASALKRGLLGGKPGSALEELKAKERLDKVVQSATEYLNAASTGITKDEAIEIADQARRLQTEKGFFRDLDRFRLSMMTGQLATTVRNVAGGSFRVAVDVFDTGIQNVLKKEWVNPFSTANYLIWNQQEAKVIRNLFEKRMPGTADKFFGTFLETAVASARLGGDTFMTRTGAKVNMLNQMSDNIFKQAIFAGKLAQKVGKTMKNADGSSMSIDDIIRTGRFNDIDNKVIKEAMDEALDFVYQRTPQGNDVFSKGGKLLLDAHQKLPFLVSSLVPFPRFVINQLNFVSQHTPLLGMVVSRMQGKDIGADVMSKQITGAGLMTVAYQLRASQGLDTEWYEIKLEDGKTLDLRPFAGPMNAFLLGADLLYRSQVLDWTEDSNELKNWVGQGKDMFQALGGPAFRAGTGLYTLDRLIEDFEGEGELGIKASKSAATFVGDMINTFTLPVATIRDLVSLADEDMRLVPQTGYTNFWDILAARATRSLPEFGFSASEFMSDTMGTGEVELRTERYDMLTGDPLRSIDPFERQIFGTGKTAPKNALQKKLIELQMSPYELYRPSEYPVEDRMLREAAGPEVAKRLNEFVRSDEFNAMGPKMQKVALADRAKEIINEFREPVRERVRTEQIERVEPGESIESDKMKFENLPARVRSMVREAYEEQYNRPMEDDYARALELVTPSRERAAGNAKGGLMSRK